MLVRDLMSQEVTALAPSCSIADVAAIMRQLEIGSLPVMEHDQLLGIITDRDIVVRVVAEGLDPHMERADFHMTRNPMAAAPDWTIDRAAQLMLSRQFRRLPVMQDGRLVGYLSLRDLARRESESSLNDTP
ncbi:MAG: CBS domain-containing protein [Chloroflexi bacterium SZAS-1]|nr:CBS domain-containing protein [Chloroflexi bacterium SZAS-1]HNP84643.1 CBS domain-containing protein [Kouleothrix sp.]